MYKGSLEGQELDISIRKDAVTITNDTKSLMLFTTDERTLIVQIATKEKDDRDHYHEVMTFYIPESVRSVLEAVFVRGLRCERDE